MWSRKKVKSEEIVKELDEKFGSEGFRKVDWPIPKRVVLPALVEEFDNEFIYLIELKFGSSDEYLPFGLYSSIERKIKENTEYFSEQGYIVRSVLITNQKVSWESLLFQIDVIKSLNINEIVETLKEDIRNFRETFKQNYEILFIEKKIQKQSRALQIVAQLSPLLDETKLIEIIEKFRNNPSPAIRGELCYLLGRWGKANGKPNIILILTNFLKDRDSWVRGQASEAMRRLKPLREQVAAQALDDLVNFIQETRERFENEHRRYQLLVRIREILREQVFEHFPADSRDRSLVAAIINATNRTVAKKFRFEYLDIFKDSLVMLRDGLTDDVIKSQLEERLLEIDDE